MATPRLFVLTWFFATALFLGLALFFPIGYLYATYENLYGEQTQFLLFLGTAICCFLSVRNGPRRYRWFWILLGLAAFYTAMEEISWGQQYFGWSSPDAFKSRNLQGETNLHNFLTGPYSTFIKDALRWGLAAAMVGYGMVYPWLLRRGSGIARLAESLGVVPPPLSLAPLFVTAAFAELEFLSFNEAEVAELLVALAVFLLSLCALTSRGHDTLQFPSAGRVLASLAIVGLGAFSLTSALYASESGKKRIDRRVAAGVEKFAGRYRRKGLYFHAESLYRRHLAADPDSPSRMRDVARVLREAGDNEGATTLLERALYTDLARAREEPWRASVQRSLVRTYRLMGDDEKAREHVRKALQIGERRLVEHPESSSAAYSIARTYDLIGRRRDAALQYQRAYELKPTNSRYRKAWLSSRRHAPDSEEERED